MKTKFTENGLVIKPDKIIKKRFYIGDDNALDPNNYSFINLGYIHEVKSKNEKKILKKKGFIFFETFEKAQNYRLAEILGG